MSAFEKLYSLLNWVIPMNVILSMVIRARKEQMKNCHHCGGVGHIEHYDYEQYNCDSDSSGFDEEIVEIYSNSCWYCVVASHEIKEIEFMLSNHVSGNQKNDNMNLLYQLTSSKYYDSLEHIPSPLEFELYIWFMLLNSFEEFMDIISMYVADGYKLNVIYNCIENITTNGNYFDSCPTKFKVYVDLQKLFIHVPYLSNPFSKFKKNFRPFCWQSQCSKNIVKFQNCVTHQNAVDVILDNTISNIDKLRQFCDMMNIDVDNMMYIFNIQENGELEEHYFNQWISYQQIKDAHNDQTNVCYALYQLFLTKTPFYDLVNGIDIMGGFFYNLVQIRYQYDDFCRKYYVGYSERLSHDDLYEVYVISRTKGIFGNHSYPYTDEFIAVKNLYDDFTEQYQFGTERYEIYL